MGEAGIYFQGVENWASFQEVESPHELFHKYLLLSP